MSIDEVNARRVGHLVYRATFGPTVGNVSAYKKMSLPEIVDQLLTDAQFVQPLQEATLKDFPVHMQFATDDFESRRQHKRKMVFAKQRLNFAWLMEMAHGKAQLADRMALFWHDHFACNITQPFLVQKQLNLIRINGLGYFGDLLRAISKDPAMMEYLDSRENKKNNPNENFGRELLELFTLGVGHYSEQDIKEASRAFTGYRYDENARFSLDEKHHDTGSKTFLGYTGSFSGDDIIDILINQPRTATYISNKIFYYLVGQEASPAISKDIANYFATTKLHIGKLVAYILKSDEFYREEYIGTRIKSPVELIAGLMRITQARPRKGSYTYITQKKLRHLLLYPPNVSGWDSGRDWLDISSLPERMKLSQIMLNSEVNLRLTQQPESSEGDEEMITSKDARVRIPTRLNPLRRLTKSTSAIATVEKLISILFTCKMNHQATLSQHLANLHEAGNIDFKELITTLTAIPEYQLN